MAQFFSMYGLLTIHYRYAEIRGGSSTHQTLMLAYTAECWRLGRRIHISTHLRLAQEHLRG